MTGRILNGTEVGGEPLVLAPPSREIDDATRTLLARERAAARAAGVAQGRLEAVADARLEAAAIATAIDAACDGVRAEIRTQHEQLAAALSARVGDAVVAVLGREPDDGGRALVARLVESLTGIDDDPVTVRVAATRHALVEQELGERRGLRVVVDERLGTDDARIVGAFADADLRTDALVAALDRVLEGEPSLGPIRPAGSDHDPTVGEPS